MNIEEIKGHFSNEGYAVIDDVFSSDEIDTIKSHIAGLDTTNPNFRKSKELFAIRRFLKEAPALRQIIFNDCLKAVINSIFGQDYFVVKSIYFDKPELSNWSVAWHQDITISVDSKSNIDGYKGWTVKNEQYSVQPPLSILEKNCTIRIHLDDTDENNGALKVIPGSHIQVIIASDQVNSKTAKETIVNVKRGGIMLMKPLLLHSSGKTTNNNPRKVIHLEFSNCMLPPEINWGEQDTIPSVE